MIIQYGPWRPDVGDWVGEPHLVDARNVMPNRDHYTPFSAASPVHPIPFDDEIRGLWASEDQTDQRFGFMGDGNKIYQLQRSTRSDVTRPGGYTLGIADRWRTATFDGDVLATCKSEPIQAFSMRNLGNYVDLSGQAPRAEFISVVGDYLVLGNLITELGQQADSVANSGFGDARDWNFTGSGGAQIKTIFDLGPVTGLTGGQVGVVLCTRGIVRIEQIGRGLGGSPFAYRTLSTEIGCEIPGTVAKFGEWTYFYSQNGWQRTNGYQLQEIGVDLIDEWFRNKIDRSKPQHFWAVSDNASDSLFFSAPTLSQDSPEGDLNQARIILVHRPNIQRSQWSYVDQPTRCLGRSESFDEVTDDNDIFTDDSDALTDDPTRFRPERMTVCATTSNEIGAFVGGPMEALLQMSALAEPSSARLNLGEFDVYHEGGVAEVSIGTSTNPGAEIEWTENFGRLSDGKFRYQTAERNIRMRTSFTGTWKRASAIEIDGRFGGRR